MKSSKSPGEAQLHSSKAVKIQVNNETGESNIDLLNNYAIEHLPLSDNKVLEVITAERSVKDGKFEEESTVIKSEQCHFHRISEDKSGPLQEVSSVQYSTYSETPLQVSRVHHRHRNDHSENQNYSLLSEPNEAGTLYGDDGCLDEIDYSGKSFAGEINGETVGEKSGR